MIISHFHKFIFLKTRKTSGTSLEITLGNICAASDIVTRFPIEEEKQRRKNNSRGRNYTKKLSQYNTQDWKHLISRGRIARMKSHTTARELMKFVSNDQWKDYFKFTIERNPWDKMVSHYFYKMKDYNLSDFEDYWKKGMRGEITGFKETLHSTEQYTTADGLITLDKIYQYEAQNFMLSNLTERLGLDKPLKMPHIRAKGNFRPQNVKYQDVLNQEQAERIGSECKWLIDQFGYTF